MVGPCFSLPLQGRCTCRIQWQRRCCVPMEHGHWIHCRHVTPGGKGGGVGWGLTHHDPHFTGSSSHCQCQWHWACPALATGTVPLPVPGGNHTPARPQIVSQCPTRSCFASAGTDYNLDGFGVGTPTKYRYHRGLVASGTSSSSCCLMMIGLDG